MADRYRDKPFPADDDYGRDNRNAPHGQGEGDPLAELARLIGQADPFSTFGRAGQDKQTPARLDPQHGAYDESEPAPDYHDEPAASRPSWIQNLAGARQTQEQPYGNEDHFEPRYSDERHDPGLQDFGHTPRFDHPGIAPLPAGQGRGQRAAQDTHYDQSNQYDQGNQYGQDGRYDDVLYGRPDEGQAADDSYGAHDGHYGDEYDRPYGDADHDAPRARRGGTMTVVVVLLLAVVGTGAAFAYRTFIGSPRSGEPPVIKADAGPNKVIPPGADGSSKQIYDRVGDKSAERVVPREEQPVDVNAKTGPRVVFPPLTQNVNPPTATSASTASRPTGAGVGNGTLGGDEPRRIRTLSIRPDQQDAAASASAAPAAAPQRAAQPAAAPRAPAPASTASTGNAPVSLAPQSPSAAAPEARPRVASVNPTAPSGGGSYVQVSSQKTEADAQASFRALQGKYSAILGSRQASIRRADLGDKGVFYRAMVGPFASTDEATQFCVNLKSAGGQCVVQRN